MQNKWASQKFWSIKISSSPGMFFLVLFMIVLSFSKKEKNVQISRSKLDLEEMLCTH
jgi:hypothetical protein